MPPFIFLFLITPFTEIATWTIDLPEVRKHFFEKHEKYGENPKNIISFDNLRAKFDNIRPDSPHNTRYPENYGSKVYGNENYRQEYDNDVYGERYADDYRDQSYMEKKVEDIALRGSEYLEGLRRALEAYGELLRNCSADDFTDFTRDDQQPWRQANERPLSMRNRFINQPTENDRRIDERPIDRPSSSQLSNEDLRSLLQQFREQRAREDRPQDSPVLIRNQRQVENRDSNGGTQLNNNRFNQPPNDGLFRGEFPRTNDNRGNEQANNRLANQPLTDDEIETLLQRFRSQISSGDQQRTDEEIRTLLRQLSNGGQNARRNNEENNRQTNGRFTNQTPIENERGSPFSVQGISRPQQPNIPLFGSLPGREDSLPDREITRGRDISPDRENSRNRDEFSRDRDNLRDRERQRDRDNSRERDNFSRDRENSPERDSFSRDRENSREREDFSRDRERSPERDNFSGDRDSRGRDNFQRERENSRERNNFSRDRDNFSRDRDEDSRERENSRDRENFSRQRDNLSPGQCERATRAKEHVRRLAELTIWATRELQDRAYSRRFKDPEENEEEELEEETNLLLKLALFLDRLAHLTGFEPRPQDYITTPGPRSSTAPTTPAVSFIGVPAPSSVTQFYANCLKNSSSNLPADERCRFPDPVPDELRRLLDVSVGRTSTQESPNRAAGILPNDRNGEQPSPSNNREVFSDGVVELTAVELPLKTLKERSVNGSPDLPVKSVKKRSTEYGNTENIEPLSSVKKRSIYGKTIDLEDVFPHEYTFVKKHPIDDKSVSITEDIVSPVKSVKKRSLYEISDTEDVFPQTHVKFVKKRSLGDNPTNAEDKYQFSVNGNTELNGNSEMYKMAPKIVKKRWITSNPMLYFMKYYAKHKVWQNDNADSEINVNSDDYHVKKFLGNDPFDVKNELKDSDNNKLNEKRERRSIKKYNHLRTPEDPFQDISDIVKHKNGVNYVNNDQQVQKIKLYLEKIRKSDSLVAKNSLKNLEKTLQVLPLKINKNIKKVTKRSIDSTEVPFNTLQYEKLQRYSFNLDKTLPDTKYQGKLQKRSTEMLPERKIRSYHPKKVLPELNRDPQMDISYYIKNKPGTNYNRNPAEVALVRAGLERVFQNPNINTVHRYGSRGPIYTNADLQGALITFGDLV